MATRSNLYGKSQIILGDKTSHGGVVISGSATNSWHGVPVARRTDKVFCPRCRPHIFEIIEGVENCTDTNARLPMATEGHATTCGATLIAESAPSTLLQMILQFLDGTGFDDRYVLRDGNGQPMSNTYYGCKKSDGSIEFGMTDASGLSAVFLTGEQAEHVVFYMAG